MSQQPEGLAQDPGLSEVSLTSSEVPNSSKAPKTRKQRSQARLQDDIDTASNDPDYSPLEESLDETSVSACSTPGPEKLSSTESTPAPIIYPSSGTVCGLCYYGEKSLLGQGELTRYDPTPGFNAFRRASLKSRGSRDSFSGLSPASESGDKTGKSPSRSRSRETRHSRDSTTRSTELRTFQVVEELSSVGCAEMAEPGQVFEPTGHVTAHHCCAAWSEGVTQNELYQLLCVDKAVHSGMSQKCSYCTRYGATIKCRALRCDRLFHYPCAAGSGCYQDIKAMLLLCPDHLEQAPSIASAEELNCAICNDIGEISDFLFCTSCGHHYHGGCLHVDVNPMVRVGWQCPECKICQTCRQPGDDNKMLVCDSCDKGYHTYCLQPAMSFIPKNGWCCQACRRCSDCGCKAQGNPSVSVWYCNDQVCENCFQLREKGLCCPVCKKAYQPDGPKDDMLHCNECKHWVHDECEDVIDMDTYFDMGTDYSCPRCRDEAEDIDVPPTSDPVDDAEMPTMEFIQDTSLSKPMDVEDKGDIIAGLKDPGKRTKISASLESEGASSGMKGSSDDPMLFSAGSQDLKKRNLSDERNLPLHHPRLSSLDRKSSSESHIAMFPDADGQDDLSSLFSDNAYQPIVSVPMLFEDQLNKDGVEWTKRKARRLSSESRSPTKPTKVVSSPGDSPTARCHGQGMGKPGAMFGRGKPFGAKRKPSVRGGRGKGASRGKGRGGRRPRGCSLSAASSLNIPSPTGGGTSPMQPSPSMTARRRSRTRWNRGSLTGADSVLGSLVASEGVHAHESADEEYGDSMHNTVVLCSADDNFTLNQDMCVVCGSFGLGAEGRLVACSQCGQCYHPYCVNLKLTKVVLRKGWRCLDCTVCEECGAADTPSQLLLCDDCDISYHTYCLKPPLQHVPKGGWKCKWCVRCVHCGSSSPGVNCDWQENYTSCGPCASLTHCPYCRRTYKDEEIIMQCSHCERWLHSGCEYLYNEMDIEKVLEKGYTCVLCRPKGSTPPHLDLNPHSFDGDPTTWSYPGRTRSDAEAVKEFQKDGVALTSTGLQYIQQLMQKSMGAHKKKPGAQRRKSQAQKLSEKVELSKPAQLAASGLMEISKDGEVLPELGQLTPTKSDVDQESGNLPLPEVDSLTGEISYPLPEGMKSPFSKEKPEVKRRRKPYRPGIGGFNVRQRGRGSYISTRGRRGARTQKGGVTISSGKMTGPIGFIHEQQKSDDVKMRATEIQGESVSNYIKHEAEGGITIAHDESQNVPGAVAAAQEKTEGQSMAVVPPLKLKISSVPAQVHPHKKRKKRTRLIDQFPPYIQEGFFGNVILSVARNSDVNAIDAFRATEPKDKLDEVKTSPKSASSIVLPDRLKQHLEAQVLQRAADAKRSAELKYDRSQGRRVASGEEDKMSIDKESEELLGVLPDDVELLGFLSTGLKQGHGGHDTHENILSPNALESLVSDGLATMNGDVTSLFSDVLNTPGNATDDHGILGDLANMSESMKSNENQTENSSSATQQDSITSTAAANNLLDHTAAVISSMENEQALEISTSSNNQLGTNEPQQMMKLQKQSQIVQQQQQQQQQQQPQQPQNPQALTIHRQLSMTHPPQPPHPGLIHRQQSMPLPQQPIHIQQAMPGQHVGVKPPGGGMVQRRAVDVHAQMQVMQPGKFPPSQTHQQQVQQQQQFAAINPPSDRMMEQGPVMPAGSHSPGMVMRPQAIDLQTSAQFRQGQPPRPLTPSSGGMAMFRGHLVQGQPQQVLSRPGSVVHSSMPQSPVIAPMVENSPAKIQGQQQIMGVSSLPDFTSDSSLFKPAPPPWPLGIDVEGDTLSVNQRNILKWEKDEPLGNLATISPVLYANMKHPYLKKEYPDWPTRAKQVAKLWRKATSDERAPYLQKARDNRAFLKATRRDLDHLTDQELLSTELPDQEEEPKHQPAGTEQSVHDPSVLGQTAGSPMATLGSVGKRTASASSSPGLTEQGNFAKPRPLSRDPTPKPMSPGTSSVPSVVTGGKSPVTCGIHPSSPIGGMPKNRGTWNENMFVRQQHDVQSFQDAGMQQQVMGIGQNQYQMPGQHSLRIPKMETSDQMAMAPGLNPCFPQQATQQPIASNTTNAPSMTVLKTEATAQQQGAMHDLASSQDFHKVIPRPGVPAQIMTQTQGFDSIHMKSGMLNQAGGQGHMSQHSVAQRRNSAVEMMVQMPITSTTTGIDQTTLHSGADVKTEFVDKPSHISSTSAHPGTALSCPPMKDTSHRQRRKLILEQQAIPGGSWAAPTKSDTTRPPPPYPNINQATQASGTAYPNARQISGKPRQYIQGTHPQSPSFSPGHHPGMSSAFEIEKYPSVPMPASSAGTGQLSLGGQTPITGGFIELKHSRQPDPAIRREQIIRAGSVSGMGGESLASSSTPVTPTGPHVTPSQAVIPKEEPVTLNAFSAMPVLAAEASAGTAKDVPSSSADEQPGPKDKTQTDETKETEVDAEAEKDSKAASANEEKQTDLTTQSGPSLPADKAEETSSETSDMLARFKEQTDNNTVVNTEHSYVKTGVPDSRMLLKKKDLDSSMEDEVADIEKQDVVVTLDGAIHGVGLTPPPDAPQLPISQEGDPLVSNIVTVDKDEAASADEAAENKSPPESRPEKAFDDQLNQADSKPTVASPSVESEELKKKDGTEESKPASAAEVAASEAKAPLAGSDNATSSSSEAKSLSEETKSFSKVDPPADSQKTVTGEELSDKELRPTSHSDVQTSSGSSARRDVSVATSSANSSTPAVASANKFFETEKMIGIASPTMPDLEKCPSSQAGAVPLKPAASENRVSLPCTSFAQTGTSVPVQAPISDIPSSSLPLTAPVASVAAPTASQIHHMAPNPALLQPGPGVGPVGVTPFPQPTIGPLPQHQKPIASAFYGMPGPAQGAGVLPPKQKSLLIKEQPLLIQDLLDEEKKEQERARREKQNQAMMQQQQQQGCGMFNSMEGEDGMAVDCGIDRILQAKIKILSGINQVINSGSSTQAAPQTTVQASPYVQHASTSQHWPHTSSSGHQASAQAGGAPSFGTDAESLQKKAAYEEWLFQHQALLQFQVKELEQAVKQHRSAKQALTKKQKQSKKSGEEFTHQDSQNLSSANQQHQDAQHQLDEVKKQQLRHSELMHDYKNKQGSLQFRGAGTLPQQQHGVVRMFSPGVYHQQQPQALTVTQQVPSTPPGGVMRQQSLPVTMSVVRQQTPRPTAPTAEAVVGNAASSHPGLSVQNIGLQQDAFISQLQKMPAFSQMDPVQIQQIAIQHGVIPGGNPPAGGVLISTSAQERGVAPLGANQARPRMAHAQVSSVNINTGSNMTPTQGAMIRHVAPDGNPVPQFTPVGFMAHQMPQAEEEKPKRKRKKKKKASDDATPTPPQVPMSPQMISPMSSPRFTIAPGMLVQHPPHPGVFSTAQFPQSNPMQAHNHQGRIPPHSNFPGAIAVSSMPQHQQHGFMPGGHGSMVVPQSRPPGSVTVSGPAVHNQFLQMKPFASQDSSQAPAAFFSSPSSTPLSVSTSLSSDSSDILKMPTAGFSPTTVKSEHDNAAPSSGQLNLPSGNSMHVNPHSMHQPLPQQKKDIRYTRQLSTPHDFSFVQSYSASKPLTDQEFGIVMSTDPDLQRSPKCQDVLSEGSMTPNSIDETITEVIRAGAEYEQRLEMSKYSGELVHPPPWVHPPFLNKNPMLGHSFHQVQGISSDAARLGNHQELLRHMLQPQNTSGGVGGVKQDLSMMPEQVRKRLEMAGGHHYFMHQHTDEVPKKKRARKMSKDKDAKPGTGKRRKKIKGLPKMEDGRLIGEEEMRKRMNSQEQFDLSPESAAIKSVSQLKPLPLPPLVEPAIKINYNMCMPKGTGLTQCKALLEGEIGNATYKGLPDYYDLLMNKDPLSYLNPPTPPSSLPPSPKRDRLLSLNDGPYHRNVEIPDSLPTPPHHGPESIEDVPITHPVRDLVEASSPEADDCDSRFQFDHLETMLVAGITDQANAQKAHRAMSPTIAQLTYPRDDTMDEKDQVSVTVAFQKESSKAVKKSLSLLSRALGTSIISFKMVNGNKPDPGLKKEDSKADVQRSSTEHATRLSGENEVLQPNQRRCFQCKRPVQGNGVRKPLFDEYALDEDIIFCNKQCYFTNVFERKPSDVLPNSTKKWKASHIYHRNTTKINISSLIEANPDPDNLSARGQRMYNLGCSFDGRNADDSTTPTFLRSSEGKGRGRGRRRGSAGPGDESRVASKRWKGIKWKRWSVSVTVVKSAVQKPPPDYDALLNKYGSALKPPPEAKDTRTCVLCASSGDGETNGVARLLNLDVDQWVHLNCALWSAEVYETQGGALINVDLAVRHGDAAVCGYCQKKGATISCNRTRCANVYHCACALKCECVFFKDKTVLCPMHTASYVASPGSGNSDQLKSLAVFRKVYVQRQETKQIASIMQQGELTQGEKNYILRVGALMFHAVGQLSTHQMTHFHSKTAIYPVGYKATRIYWSSNNTRKRCKYMCMITDKDGKPFFTTLYQAVATRAKTGDQSNSLQGQWIELSGANVNEQWYGLLQQLANLRFQQKMLKLFPAYINGDNIFGLTSPVVCRILESLPNIELCASYKFRFGRSPLLELPLAINPTGCARTEPHIKHSRKKPHTLISNLISEYYESTGIGDASSSLYGKQFVHSKSSQYRRMKQDWRSNVYLARSRIQGLGLFAARDIEPGTMVIEYIGETIRSEVAEKREKYYEAANRGVYMFRLDSDYIVDATVSGGPARYINHSCNPNCVAEVVNFEKEKKIMIISNRHILRGEELNYDYKFDFEDEGNKIPCLCGAINCRKWMN